MAKEIEYKYLVDAHLWASVKPLKSIVIQQAYILTEPEKTIRVRVKGDKGFITIKGKNVGATRLEYEYQIPLIDAQELMDNFGQQRIDKVRHIVIHDGFTWEVDVFAGENQGLIVAELEVESEDVQFPLPAWVTDDVTQDMRYANSNLSILPFKSW